MTRMIGVLLAAAALAMLTGGCSTLRDASALKRDFKVLSAAKYNNPDPGNEALYNDMLGDLRSDHALASDRSRKWDRAEGVFNIALLAAAAYGGYNTVYDGGNLKDAAFAAASITSLRTFSTPQKRRDAFNKAAGEMACVVEHAQKFVQYRQVGFAKTDGGSLKLDFAVAGGRESMNDLASSYVAAQMSTVDNLIADLTKKSRQNVPVGNYSASRVQEIGDLRLDQNRRIEALTEAVAKIIEAKKLQNEIFNERFSLVRGEYVAILDDLFSSLRFPAVDYVAESEAYAKAKGDADAINEDGAEAEAMMKTAGGPAGLAALGFSDPKKLADAKAALLACNNDE